MTSKSPCVDLPGFAEPLVRRESKPDGILKKGPSVWTKEAETQQKVRNWTNPGAAGKKANVKMPAKPPETQAPVVAVVAPTTTPATEGVAQSSSSSSAAAPPNKSTFQNIERDAEAEFKEDDQDKKPAATNKKEETMMTAADIAAFATADEKVQELEDTPPPVRTFDRTVSSSSVLERITSPGRISRVKARKSVLEAKGVTPRSMLGKVKKPAKKGNTKKKPAQAAATKKRKQSGADDNPSAPKAAHIKPSLIWQGEPADTGIDIDWKGWRKEIFERMSGKSKGNQDSYRYTPVEGKKLRSINEVRRFMAALKECNGDELKAWTQFKAK